MLDRIDAFLGGVRISLRERSAFELLVSVVLSAQCTDARVDQVTPALFARYPTPADMARAEPRELEGLIRPCGLFRTKARSLISTAAALVERHGGEVPIRRAALEELPGVGHKTAGVVAMHLGGDAAFPVDTHILRLAHRLGFSQRARPGEVEEDLRELWPQSQWLRGHHALILFGRRACTARHPACGACVVSRLCPRVGVGD